jgi:hypothetical protein
MSQTELEQWVGAAAGIAPTSGQSEYLFSGLTPLSSVEMVTAPRWLIVLVASAVVLAMAAAWVYVPAARRGWILVALSVLLAGLAVAFPTPALLAAQASVLGVFLGILSLIISRLARGAIPAPGFSGISRTPILSSGSSRHSPTTTHTPNYVAGGTAAGLTPFQPAVTATAATPHTTPFRAEESQR